MQLHHDFHPETDMRSREAEEWTRQASWRKAARGATPNPPEHGLRHLLTAAAPHRHILASGADRVATKRTRNVIPLFPVGGPLQGVCK